MGIYEKNNCRILGKGQWISNDDIKSGLNNNDLIIGGTGSGKTGGYVIPNIRQANGNMVITDTKSILYKKLGKELEKQGYDVSILDFVNPERSDTYNPLEYIRTVNHFGLADYNHKDIISLSRVLVPTRIKHDPFWEESARTVMAFLIAFTLEALREEIDILLNQSWEYCMPRYISRDELIYLIQNNFVIKAGSYFNKTKMDADNYYVKAYDMHELPEIINGLS